MKIAIFVCLLTLSGLISCQQHHGSHEEVALPAEIDSIFSKSCATVGCHLPDDDNFEKPLHQAGKLDLSSWSGLFHGGEHGSVVIPYQAKYSELIKHITGENTPRMPPAGYDTLPAAEVDQLIAWIDAGAPSAEGEIPFADITNRIYTTNQTNDLVSLVDAKSLLVARIFEVGEIPDYTESPHGIKVSPDGETFFISMLAGTGQVFQYDALTGQFLAKYNLDSSLALMALSSDGAKLYVATNFLVNNTGELGSISVLHAANLSYIKRIHVGQSPHGLTLSRDGRFLYTMSVYQDRIYVIDTQADTVAQIIDVASDVGPSTQYGPYHIAVTPANSQGYEDYVLVSCAVKGEVRIFQRTGTQFNFVDSVRVGSSPIGMEVTPDGKFVYVANYGDSSVSVIKKVGNYFAFDRTISAQVGEDGNVHRLSQPLGVRISKDGKYVYVTNRNKNGAVLPHHGGSGGPGLLTVIEVSSNTIIKTIEMQPDAYTVDVWP